jgi:hypothetical protein
MPKQAQTQNLTLKLSTRTLKQARMIAASRSLSMSKLVTQQLEQLVGEHEEYERNKRKALALLDAGFSMGGTITATREELHER